MKIEDLDTLLRNKLQMLDSEIQSDEFSAIKGALEPEAKNKKKFFSWSKLAIVLAFFAIGASLVVANLKTASKIEKTAHINQDKLRTNQNSKLLKPENAAINPNVTNNNSAIIVKENQANLNEDKNSDALPNMPAASNINKGNALHNNINMIFGKNNILPKNIEQPLTNQTIVENGFNNLTFKNRKYKRIANQAPLTFSYELIDQVFAENKPNKDKKSNAIFKYLKPELEIWTMALNSTENTALENASNSQIHKDFLQINSKAKANVWTISTGAKVQLKLLNTLSLGSGIGYFKTGSNFKLDYKINNIPIIDSASNTIVAYIKRPDSLSQSVSANGAHIGSYLEIPISLKFNFYNYKRVSIGIEGTYAKQFLLKETGQSIDEQSLFFNNDLHYKKHITNFQFGLPISYSIANKTKLTLMPFYGNANGNISNTQNIINTRTYKGIRMSLNYIIIK